MRLLSEYIILPVVFFIILFCPLSEVEAKSKKLLVVMKSNRDFVMVANSIQHRIGNKYDTVELKISDSTPYVVFKESIKKHNPDLAILMDNKSIELAMKYNKEEKRPISGVGIMGLNLKGILKGDKNLCGIAYEVPAYTLLSELKHTTGRNVKEAIVFYRESQFGGMVRLAKERLKVDQINLRAINVEVDGSSLESINSFLKNNASKLIKQGRFDAMWIMLDSGLLTPELFNSFWKPLAKELQIPIAVGMKNFVDPKVNFAFFGMSPNLEDLADQTMQIVDGIMEEGESCSEYGVEDLISVHKFLNYDQMKKFKVDQTHVPHSVKILGK